ncbi:MULTISPECIES: squalene synthase HpnC [Paraburkholderia]|uniref:Squalene synthase HpnC n=1 Tax=Paraburkholderia phenazinium TaxID=60549 RepID=A0A1N6JS06_9BURK|nr:squalene synthase HpnC [Paraburkholderia phenazinium]SIO47003.1 squalene synthase HpnC [Paraburkholderia phenazinium]
MEADHYENLPIAGALLPKRLRTPVGVIYQVARTAADIAEEGDWSAAERHTRLADFRAGLDAVASGRMAPVHPLLFGKLAGVVAQYKLPLAPFYDLVAALDQEIDTTRFADRSALLDYCRRSAHPVGHLMLHLFGAASPANLADSDTICTALHLINFWQNVAIDFKNSRVYLPQSDLARFNVSESQIGGGVVDDRWRALMAYEVAYARAMLVRGAPLALRIPGRAGIVLCGIVHGGLRILERIERAGYDVFRHRPALDGFDWSVVTARALAMWLSRRVSVRATSIEGNA